MDIVIKLGPKLTNDELNQVNEAVIREFNVTPLAKNDISEKTFFFLKEKDRIVAMSALLRVEPVIFNDKTYTLFGFSNTVANIKGKGYGKKVIESILSYLKSQNVSAIGFCMPNNLEFYLKCGLLGETNSTHRFVYKKGDEEIRNKDGQVIFYIDGEDGFMKNVLSDDSKSVYLPSDKLW